VSNNELSISGGDEKSRYLISELLDQTALFYIQVLKILCRVNYEKDVSDKFKVSTICSAAGRLKISFTAAL